MIEHYARDRPGIRFHHCFPDHREGFLAKLIVGDQEMGRVVPDPADRIGRQEAQSGKGELFLLDDGSVMKIPSFSSSLPPLEPMVMRSRRHRCRPPYEYCRLHRCPAKASEKGSSR